MRRLRKINQIVYYSTLILWITIIGGMYAQIILGLVQVISAIIVTKKTYYNYEFAKKPLRIYWSIIIVITIILNPFFFEYILLNDNYTLLKFIAVFFIPMIIATYFLIICNKITTVFYEDLKIKSE